MTIGVAETGNIPEDVSNLGGVTVSAGGVRNVVGSTVSILEDCSVVGDLGGDADCAVSDSELLDENEDPL